MAWNWLKRWYGVQEESVNVVPVITEGGVAIEATENASEITGELFLDGTFVEVEEIVFWNKKELENKYVFDAIVKGSGDMLDEDALANEIAVRVGYHPAGYGCWNTTVREIEPGLYQVGWTSRDTCH